MFERYTEKARRTIFFARYEASQFGWSFIESEHLLLGLVREGKAELFMPDRARAAGIRERILHDVTPREKISTQVDIPLSNECKRALVFAAEEAAALGHPHLGPEHLFVGVLREESCFAARLMRECGASLEHAREALAKAPAEPPDITKPDSTIVVQSVLNNPDDYRQQKFVEQMIQRPESVPEGFEGYTELAKRAVFFAKYETIADCKEVVGTEHLLRGLLHVPGGDFYRFLPVGLSAESVAIPAADRRIVRADPDAIAQLPLSDECKQAMAFANEEARALHDEKIAVEHLLVGLLRTTNSAASKIMRERGADLDELRRKLQAGAPPDAAASH